MKYKVWRRDVGLELAVKPVKCRLKIAPKWIQKLGLFTHESINYVRYYSCSEPTTGTHLGFCEKTRKAAAESAVEVLKTAGRKKTLSKIKERQDEMQKCRKENRKV